MHAIFYVIVDRKPTCGITGYVVILFDRKPGAPT